MEKNRKKRKLIFIVGIIMILLGVGVIRYYDIDVYTNIEGVVTEHNPPYRRLKGVKTASFLMISIR